MRIPLSAAACAAVLGVAVLSMPSAQAGELCAGAPVPGAGGVITDGSTCGLTAVATPVTAMFVGFSAADTDTLSLTGVNSSIFTNNVTAPGTVVALSVTPGSSLDFVLTDATVANVFHIGTAYPNTTGNPTPDPSVYHFAEYTFASQADYNSVFAADDVALTSGELTEINSLGGFAAWTFVGVEDRTTVGTDDWNDLVYAFHNVAPPPSVPEPMTLSLFGAGLVGAGWMRRRKNKSA
jgi:hypothetical protein